MGAGLLPTWTQDPTPPMATAGPLGLRGRRPSSRTCTARGTSPGLLTRGHGGGQTSCPLRLWGAAEGQGSKSWLGLKPPRAREEHICLPFASPSRTTAAELRTAGSRVAAVRPQQHGQPGSQREADRASRRTTALQGSVHLQARAPGDEFHLSSRLLQHPATVTEEQGGTAPQASARACCPALQRSAWPLLCLPLCALGSQCR